MDHAALKPATEPPRHFSMIRAYRLADVFTLANGASGMAAVLLAMRYVADPALDLLLWAAAFIVAALVFDVFDGRVARARNEHSPFGRELDSLADIVSFGVAPATLAHAVGLRGGWDALILVYFVCCGVSRLARFNVTAEALSAGGDKVRYFEGMPIPTSVLLVAVLAVAAWLGYLGPAMHAWQLGPWVLHPLALLFALSGSMMISKSLRVPKW